MIINKLLTNECRLKCGCRVALGTICSEGSVVHVLGLVAGIAIGWQVGLGDVFSCVAVIATQFGVSTIERIFCIAAVVKCDPLPAQSAMAAGAVLGESTFVGVVFGVAGKTCGGRTLEGGRGVT